MNITCEKYAYGLITNLTCKSLAHDGARVWLPLHPLSLIWMYWGIDMLWKLLAGEDKDHYIQAHPQT